MKVGELKDAKRRALNILERWVDVTGLVEKNEGYYYELQGLIEDAVDCGAQAASGVRIELDSEKS